MGANGAPMPLTTVQADAHSRPSAFSEDRPQAWQRLLGSARIALGGIFLWAFVDKLFGLGFATPSERAWVNGGSPTMGYLSSSTGPLGDAFQAIAGHAVTDALFMLGLFSVGAALMVGIGTLVSALAGSLMMAMMYLSHPPWAAEGATNPVLDDHVAYALMLLAMAGAHAGRFVGLGRAWEKSALVRHHPWLA